LRPDSRSNQARERVVVMPHDIPPEQVRNQSAQTRYRLAEFEILRSAVAELAPNLLIHFVDRRDDISRTAVLCKRNLDARASGLTRFDEYEAVLV